MTAKRAVSWSLKIGLGAGILWFMVRSETLELHRLAAAVRSRPWLCAGALAAFWACIVIPTWLRWLILARQAGIAMSAKRAWSLHMIGMVFNSVVPGGAGGDLVKGFYLFREEGRGRTLALTSLAMDRFIGLYGLLCMGMLMTCANPDLWRGSRMLTLNSLAYAGVFLGFTAVIAFFLSPFSRFFLEHPALHRLPGGRFLKSFSDALLAYRGRPRALALALALSLVVHGGFILVYAALAQALEMGLPLRIHGFAVPALTLVNGIPVSPAGLGVGEVAGEALYRALGGGAGGGELLALVHLCTIGSSLAGLPFYLLYRRAPGAEPAGAPSRGA